MDAGKVVLNLIVPSLPLTRGGPAMKSYCDNGNRFGN